MELDPITQRIIMAIVVGLPVGIATGILVKKYAKSKQETIYEHNRERIIHLMLSHMTEPLPKLRKV